MNRRTIVSANLVGLTALLGTACAPAGGGGGDSAYPSKRIEIVVPFPAGGATDSLARVWSECLEDELGQTITVVNREGAQGGTGAAFVADSKPDGYTLAIVSESPLMLLPETVEDIGFEYDDFTYLAMLGSSPDVLYAKPGGRFDSIDDVLAAAQDDSIKMANYSPATTARMRADAFVENSDLPWTVVPFDTSTDKVQSVVSGVTDIGYGDVSIPMFEQMNAGNLTILAAGEDISVVEDGIPIIEDAGLTGFDGLRSNLVFLLGPQDLPGAVADGLQEAVETCRDAATVSDALQVQLLPDEGTVGQPLQDMIDDLAQVYRDAIAGGQ